MWKVRRGVLTRAALDGSADITSPTITSASTANNVENIVLAHALTANETVTWSIVGGVDQAKFEISGSTLRWASDGVKDYESPDDNDTNNTYVVNVRATDLASNTADQTITITVTDASDLKWALVRKASDQTAADYSTATLLSWDAEVADTNAFHSGGDPTKLTIPSTYNGYYVVVTACVEITSLTANSNLSLEILKGGSANYDGRSGDLYNSGAGADASTKGWVQCSTQPIQVSTGDYFEAKLLCSDTSVTIVAASSSFSVRVIDASINGCLVKKAADQTAANFSAGVIVTWDSEVYDSGTYHDTGSNTSRITIPVGANGKYGIVTGVVHLSSVTAASTGYLATLLSGAAHDGMAWKSYQSGTLTDLWMHVKTQPLPLTTAQYFEVQLLCSDTSTTLEQEHSTWGIQVLDTVTGALVVKSADQTAANYSTPAVVTWNAELYDTDASHDTSADPSRFTVPSALNGRYAIFHCQISGTSHAVNSAASLCILKNGSSAYNGFGGVSRHSGNTTSLLIQCYTQPVLLATGDYYEAKLYCSDNSITVEEEWSSFGMLVI